MKKKVLFVISTLNTGGAQRAFSNIIMNLPECYEVDILLNDRENIVYPYRGTIIDLGLKPQKNKIQLQYQLHVFWKRFWKLNKLKKSGQYTACISALESANLVNIITGNKKSKSIVSVRNYHNRGWLPSYIEPIVNWLMKTFYSKADAVVAVSDGIAEDLYYRYKIPREKIVTIYNGYDINKIRCMANQEGDLKNWKYVGNKVIITSGRMEKQKGQWHLLKAFSLVLKSVPQARLIILGNGELRKEMEQLCVKLDIVDKVCMPGFVTNPFVYIGKSDVFVLPSLFEGYPNALAEAMICGIPCIASDCRTGPREILGDNVYGILTAPFDIGDMDFGVTISKKEEELANEIIKLLVEDNLYEHYKEKAIEKSEQFEMKQIVNKWIALFK